MVKQRAGRNRTLSLTEAEFIKFRKRIYHPGIKPLGLPAILNKTLQADLFSIIDFLPSEFADLIIIDPPYNLDKDFHGLKFSRIKDQDYSEYLNSWFPKVVKCLKPNGSLYVCGDWKNSSLLHSVMKANLNVLNRITWQREKGRGAGRNWKNAMEDIWFGVKDASHYYFDLDAVKVKRRVVAPYKEDGKPKDWMETREGNFRVTHPSNFWDDITIPYWSMSENTDHPTQKPEKLLAKLILASCPENGLVFDPFLGSGTTSVVAKKLGRNYCGIEINGEYCCWAEARLEKVNTHKSIQGFSEGIFWERNSGH